VLAFARFLTESLDVDKLKHLEHAEDHIIHGGDEGVSHAADNLEDVHNLLLGKKSKSKLTVKYDGSPSVVFGKDPETGNFFVASKSAFNVNPKINYTPEDVDRNHGHAPGLAAKLKAALGHLPKVMPHQGGVYQGDFLYERPDVEDENGRYKFAPNTITYSADKDSPQGRKIAASKIGFVVHTRYSGKKLADMKAGFDVDHGAFKQDPHVNLVNPEIKEVDPSRYTSKVQQEYQDHKDKALDAYRALDLGMFDKLSEHDQYLKPYINQTVRDGTKPTAIGYSRYLEAKRESDVSKVKTDSAKKRKEDQYNKFIDDVGGNADQFSKALELHSHLQQAKDTLVKALGNPTEFEHTVGGKQVKPEGFVSIRNGRPTKLVDRAEFSRLNFANNRGKGDPEATAPTESEIHHVFAFGRMNPPTVGHGALVGRVMELANANKAGHSIVLSNSQDPEKNPLSAEQKLKHAQRFFPDANVSVASKEAPTFIHQLKDLHSRGVTHVTMVAGSDRIDEYKKLLDRYNGPHKEFNFKSINVVSAGERDPDAEGVSGMSASKMRGHAMTGKFSEFKKGIPQHINPEHSRELYDDVRKAMDIKIGPDTSNISLGKYAKRTDVIGTRARAELKRRGKLNEESTVDIRGLGLVSGNPVVDSDAIKDYFDTNMKASEAERKELDKRLQKWGLRGFIDHTKSLNTKKAKGTLF
jgi:hypothetical protein